VVAAALRAGPGLVVDIGTGRGTTAERLARAGRRVLAIDTRPDDLAEVSARVNVPAAAGRAEALPLASAVAGTVIAGEVLEHIGDHESALREIARVLMRGGHLVATVPAGALRYGAADARAGHLRRYDRAGLVALVEGAGLRVEKLQGWGWPVGRIYERLIQAPGLRLAQGGGASGRTLSRLAESRILHRLARVAFGADRLAPQGNHSVGWLLVARR
jgi:SAM-dependent methyltransferase